MVSLSAAPIAMLLCSVAIYYYYYYYYSCGEFLSENIALRFYES